MRTRSKSDRPLLVFPFSLCLNNLQRINSYNFDNPDETARGKICSCSMKRINFLIFSLLGEISTNKVSFYGI